MHLHFDVHLQCTLKLHYLAVAFSCAMKLRIGWSLSWCMFRTFMVEAKALHFRTTSLIMLFVKSASVIVGIALL